MLLRTTTSLNASIYSSADLGPPKWNLLHNFSRFLGRSCVPPGISRNGVWSWLKWVIAGGGRGCWVMKGIAMGWGLGISWSSTLDSDDCTGGSVEDCPLDLFLFFLVVGPNSTKSDGEELLLKTLWNLSREKDNIRSSLVSQFLGWWGGGWGFLWERSFFCASAYMCIPFSLSLSRTCHVCNQSLWFLLLSQVREYIWEMILSCL